MLAHEKAGKPSSDEPWDISDDALSELQERFAKLGDVRQYLRPAAAKCRDKYPRGGPMKADFFNSYLQNLRTDHYRRELERRIEEEKREYSAAPTLPIAAEIAQRMRPQY